LKSKYFHANRSHDPTALNLHYFVAINNAAEHHKKCQPRMPGPAHFLRPDSGHDVIKNNGPKAPGNNPDL